MQTKLVNIFKDGNIVIPLYLLRSYKEFHLNLDEFIFLMYLYNKKFTTYNPIVISDELKMDINEVMGYISQLADKGLISLDINKTNGVIEENISLNNFYEKISIALINNKENVVKDNSIYENIEQEFNRKLTPMEREVVLDWQNNDIPDELIKEALKEASLNGILNLRFIDKLLFEWHKKGYQRKEDIQKDMPKDEKMEIYNCNWFDDDDEI